MKRLRPARHALQLLMLLILIEFPSVEASDNKPVVRQQYARSATTATFSPNGEFFAAGSDKRIWVFNSRTLEQLSTMVDYEYVNYNWKFQYRYGFGNSLVFISDNEIVSTGLGAMLTQWDARSGQLLNKLDWDPEEGYPISLTWSASAGLLVAGTGSGVVKLIWPGTQKPSRMLQGADGAILSLLVSEDGRYLAAASDSHQITIWDLHTFQEYARLPTRGSTIEIAPFGKPGQLLVAGGNLEIWNFLSQEEVGTLENPELTAQVIGSGALFALSVIPFYGYGVSSPSHVGQFYLPTSKLGDYACSRAVAVSPDGSLVADMHPGIMREKTRIINAVDGQVLKELNPRGGRSCDLEFSPDGSRLLIGNNRGVHLYDTESWEVERVKMQVSRLEK